MVEVFVVFDLVPARRGERIGVGAREHRAVGEIEEFGRVANAERVEHQFTRTDVDEGVYELLHAGVAAFVFVHVKSKRQSVGRRFFIKEKEKLNTIHNTSLIYTRVLARSLARSLSLSV